MIAPSQKRTVVRILATVGEHPGHTGVGLHEFGLKPADGTMLRTLEGEGLVDYDGGWHVTPAGTEWLMANG